MSLAGRVKAYFAALAGVLADADHAPVTANVQFRLPPVGSWVVSMTEGEPREAMVAQADLAQADLTVEIAAADFGSLSAWRLPPRSLKVSGNKALLKHLRPFLRQASARQLMQRAGHNRDGKVPDAKDTKAPAPAPAPPPEEAFVMRAVERAIHDKHRTPVRPKATRAEPTVSALMAQLTDVQRQLSRLQRKTMSAVPSLLAQTRAPLSGTAVSALVFLVGCLVAAGAGVLAPEGVVALPLGYLALSAALAQMRPIVRRVRVYGVTLYCLAYYRFVRSRVQARKLDDEQANELYDKAHDKLAPWATRVFVETEGFWLKVGQYVSSRADVAPTAWVRHLATLQDRVPAKPLHDVLATIKEDLGPAGLERFALFDAEPLAAASIAQVHRAVLKDPAPGEPADVVVKVQHRNIEAIMRADMVDLRLLTRFVAWLEPDFDFAPLLDEWVAESRKELDFLNEVSNMVEVAQALGKQHLDVIIPRPMHDLCTKRVLTMEYVEGFKINDLAAFERAGVEPLDVMRRVCEAFATQIFLAGLFHSDSHPGNLLCAVNPDGTVAPILLDFGLCKRLDDAKRIGFARLIHSVGRSDFGGLLESFEEIGLVLNRLDPAEDLNNLQYMFRASDDPASMQAQVAERRKFHRRRRERREEWIEQRAAGDDELAKALRHKTRNPVDAYPADFLFFFRVVLLLRGLFSSLKVRLSYLDVMAPYARLALLQRYPVHLHAARPIYAMGDAPETRIQRVLERVVTRLYDQGEVLGIQVSVVRNGQLLADVAGGVLGEADPRPVRRNTLFSSFSVTKAVTALALHRIVDSTAMSYDSRVADVWPGFIRGHEGTAKSEITVRDVLAHTAGMANTVAASTRLQDLIEFQTMVQKLEAAVPDHPPGEKQQYHFLSFGWLVAAIVERADRSGLSFRDYVQTHIAQSLDLGDELQMGLESVEAAAVLGKEGRLASLSNAFLEGLSTEEIKEMVDEYRSAAGAHGSSATNADSAIPQSVDATESVSSTMERVGDVQIVDPCLFNLAQVRAAVVPAANGHFTARALARMFSALASGGRGVVSPETARTMLEESPADSGRAWSLGLRRYGFSRPGVRAIGHAGVGGSLVFCARHGGDSVSVAILVNRLTLSRSATMQVVSVVADEMGLGMPLDFEG